MLRASTAIKQTRMLTGCFLKVIFFAVHVHGLLEIYLNTKVFVTTYTKKIQTRFRTSEEYQKTTFLLRVTITLIVFVTIISSAKTLNGIKPISNFMITFIG